MKKLLAGLLSLVMTVTVSATPLAENLSNKVMNTSISANAETSGDYLYEVLSDGTVKIIDYYGSATNLTIPSTIDGKSVTSIGWNAFENCTSLINVTIPNSVTYIGQEAFCGCTNLTNVIIPNSVTYIGQKAFYDCTSLTSVAIPNGVKGIGGLTFYGCTSLISVTIPNGIADIGILAFYGCSSLTSITIPNRVTSIGSFAFQGCSNLESITIPNSVTDIGDAAFSCCTSLTNLTISDGVTSIGNCAFISCINLTSVIIPNSVTSIGDQAFDGCINLTNVIIPNSVTSIGDSTFHNCISLTSVTIPNGVTSIGEQAFSNCYSLKDVYYDATKEKWDKIDIGEDNNGLINATKHFHIHSYISKLTKQPTCTTTGVKTYTCSCGDTYTETIEKIPHNYSTLWTVDKQATCTEKGLKSHHCIVCDDITDITAIPATEHDFSDWKVTKPASCSSTGTKERTCSICGEIEKQTIKKIEHNYKSEITRQPTCTTTGVRTYTCACGDSYTEIIPKLNHSYEGKITKEPTCTATGIKTYTCSCGDSYTETIPKTAHSYKKVTIASTYFEKGYTANKCSKCGAISNKKYTSLKTMSAPKTSSNSTSSIKLSWGKVSGAKGYVVYQKKSGKWSRIKVTASNSYTVSKLKSGTTYQFCVKPYTKSGTKTIYGNASKTLTSSTNPAKVSFKLTAGTKKVTVKWSKVTGASGYKVYYKTSQNGSWKLLKTCNNKTTSYTKTGLSKGKTYYFTVKAYRNVNGKTYNGSYTTKSIKSK